MFLLYCTRTLRETDEGFSYKRCQSITPTLPHYRMPLFRVKVRIPITPYKRVFFFGSIFLLDYILWLFRMR